MKNNGFTLTELLLVIALIGILSVILVPNVIDSFKKSLNKTMEIVENNVMDAAEVYEYEHCIDPIYDPVDKTKYVCPTSYLNDKYICLSELTNGNNPYIESVKYDKVDCNGFIDFNNNKVYLYCGDYVTDKNVTNKCF